MDYVDLLWGLDPEPLQDGLKVVLDLLGGVGALGVRHELLEPEVPQFVDRGRSVGRLEQVDDRMAVAEVDLPAGRLALVLLP